MRSLTLRSLLLIVTGRFWCVQVMGEVENLTSEESAPAEVERRTALLRTIGFAATHIIAVNDWRTGIQELLDRLGQATGVSRVTLFEVHLGPEGWLVESIRYDWAEPGLAKLADNARYQNMPMSDEDRSGDLGEWARRRARGDVVQATLREVRGYTREVFLEHGTLSFASVPIMVGGRFWGFLGFDDCKTERVCARARTRSFAEARSATTWPPAARMTGCGTGTC